MATIKATKLWLKKHGNVQLEFDVEKIELDPTMRRLVSECSHEERTMCGLGSWIPGGEQSSCCIDTVEAEIPESMYWKPNGGLRFIVVDNFILVNSNGQLVGLDILNKTRYNSCACLLFGTIVSPEASLPKFQNCSWDHEQLFRIQRNIRLIHIPIENWCLEFKNNAESLWVISDSGNWYKLSGEIGSDRALSPSPLYENAFREARCKYEACKQLSRVLRTCTSKRKYSVESLLQIASTRSQETIKWSVDMEFMLSRARFLAEQMRSLHYTDKANHSTNDSIWIQFALDLRGNRAGLIKRLFLENGELPKKKRLRKRSDSEDEEWKPDQSKKFARDCVSFPPSKKTAFPMDDANLLELLISLSQGQLQTPKILKELDFKGQNHPLNSLPLPPQPGSVFFNEKGCCSVNSLDKAAIGSLFSSYQILSMHKEILQISPFGIDELLSSVSCEPSSQKISKESLSEKDLNIPDDSRGRKKKKKRTKSGRHDLDKMPCTSGCSPLFTEIVLSLLEFILKQPENKDLAQRIKEECTTQQTLAVPPRFNRLTWPTILAETLSAFGESPAPECFITMKRAKIDDCDAQNALKNLSNGFMPLTVSQFLEAWEIVESSMRHTTETNLLLKCRNIIEDMLATPASKAYRLRKDPNLPGAPKDEMFGNSLCLGTILDRLYAGFYCVESSMMARQKHNAYVRNLRAWELELSMKFLPSETIADAQRFVKYVRHDIIFLQRALESEHQTLIQTLKSFVDRLQALIRRRGMEVLRREAKRLENLRKIYSADVLNDKCFFEDQFTHIKPILALQNYEVLGVFAVEATSPKLDLKTFDEGINILSSLDPVIFFSTPPIFRVMVSQVHENHPTEDWIQPRDLVIAINSTSLANMTHVEALNLIQEEPNPINFLIARRVHTDVQKSGRVPSSTVVSGEQDFDGDYSEPVISNAMKAEYSKEDEALSESTDEESFTTDFNSHVKTPSTNYRGHGLDGFFLDIQNVFQKSIRSNSRSPSWLCMAKNLKRAFEAHFDRVLSCDLLSTSSNSGKKLSGHLPDSFNDISAVNVVDCLLTYSPSAIPPRVRAWILQWLAERALQARSIHDLIEAEELCSPINGDDEGKNGACKEFKTKRSSKIIDKDKVSDDGINSAAFSIDQTPLSSASRQSEDVNLNHSIACSPLKRLEPIGSDRFFNRYWWFDEDPLGRILVETPTATGDDVYPCMPMLYCTKSDSGNVHIPADKENVERPSMETQKQAVRQCAKNLRAAHSSGENSEWGALRSRRQLDNLIAALNPLGEKEFALLEGLNLLYRRIAVRMEVSGLGKYSTYAKILETHNHDFENPELSAKLAYGRAAMSVQRRALQHSYGLHNIKTQLPAVSQHGLTQFLTPHGKYQNSGRLNLEHSTQIFENYLSPLAEFRSSVMRAADTKSDEKLFVQFITALEVEIWGSRSPHAMGPRWPWPEQRKHWHKNLSKYLCEENSLPNDEFWKHMTESILTLEGLCIAYWCDSGGTSISGSCVNLLWRMRRTAWRHRVRQARCISELTCLVRELAVESIRFESLDRVKNLLFASHLSENTFTHSADSPIDTNMPFWKLKNCGKLDVTFGQLLSNPSAIYSFGAVSLGAFLGSHLFAALHSETDRKAQSSDLGFLSKGAVKVGAAVLETAVKNCEKVYVSDKTNPMPAGNSGAENYFLRKAMKEIMLVLNLKQNDVASQIGCTQDQFNAWLDELPVSNIPSLQEDISKWVRLSNLVFGWFNPLDAVDKSNLTVDVHAGLSGLDYVSYMAQFAEIEYKAPDSQDPLNIQRLLRKYFEVLQGSQSLPINSLTNTSELNETVGGDCSSNPKTTAGNTYQTLFKSSVSVQWKDVIPYQVSTVHPRLETSPIAFSLWFEMLSNRMQDKIHSAGLRIFHHEKKRPLVFYWPEGHAFANAHNELRFAVEAKLGGRPYAIGPSISNVFPSREPILCYLIDATFHSGESPEKFAPQPYAVYTLQPISTDDSSSSDKRAQIFLDKLRLDPAGQVYFDKKLTDESLWQRKEVYSHQVQKEDDISTNNVPFRGLRDILIHIMLHLLNMPDAKLCMRSLSSNLCPDLVNIVGSVDKVIDLSAIRERVGSDHYQSTEEFLADLEKMADYKRLYFVELHKFGANVAQAAANILMRAKLLLRHPETLCELSARQTTRENLHPTDLFKVVVRPRFELAFPSYIAEAGTVIDALKTLKLGDKVRQPRLSGFTRDNKTDGRAPLSKIRKTGKIVGFRYPLPNMRLVWGSIVVNWECDGGPETVDKTLDFPQFANMHVNPWDIDKVSDSRSR